MQWFDALAAARWTGGKWIPASPEGLGFETVFHDTRTSASAGLFVAIAGERVDGHALLSDAVEAGACAAIVDHLPATAPAGLPLLLVEHTGDALMALGAGYRAAHAATIVGVTGSVGKSTVKELIAAMLEQAAVTARTKGNWNNQIGLPLSLLAMPPDASYGVFEVGMNAPGEIAELCGILAPDVGVVTAIAPVHVEAFDDVAGIVDEKAALPRAIGPAGFVVVDADTPHFEQLVADTRCQLVTISTGEGATYRYLSDGRDTVTITEHATGESADLPLPLPGHHVAFNVCLAVACCRQFDLAWDAIAGALRIFEPMEMRWQSEQVGGVTMINDAYNANPLSMRAAIRTLLGQADAPRAWLVLGGMLELGDIAASEHRSLGAFVAEFPLAGVVTVGQLGSVIADAVEANTATPLVTLRCETAAEAGPLLGARLAAGDTILFKASRGFHLEVAVDYLRHYLGDDDQTD